MTEPTQIQQFIWDRRASLGRTLANRYALFVHETNALSVNDIARCGLEARHPGTGIENAVVEAFGYISGKMVGLHPVGSFPTFSNQPPPYSLLAVLPNALPPQLTIDWTYANAWELANVVVADAPTLTPEQVFLRVVNARGSVAGLRTIASQDLFILCGDPTKPTWRPLVPGPLDIISYPQKGAYLDAIKDLPLPVRAP